MRACDGSMTGAIVAFVESEAQPTAARRAAPRSLYGYLLLRAKAPPPAAR
jgi:hypothetical protein